jgi:anti-anti-sigma factor
MKFSITEDQGTVAQIAVQGSLTQQDIAPPLDPFRAALGHNAYQRNVLLDLNDSSYLDSMCIGWLLNAHKRFREQGGKLVIHSLQPVATNAISLLRLNTVFHMASDKEKALQLVQGEVA